MGIKRFLVSTTNPLIEMITENKIKIGSIVYAVEPADVEMDVLT